MIPFTPEERFAKFAPSQNMGQGVDPDVLAVLGQGQQPTEPMATVQPTMPTIPEIKPVDPDVLDIVNQGQVPMMASLKAAARVNPDEAAQAARLGSRIGVGQDIALRNMPEVRERAFMADVASRDLMRSNPVLGRMLTDREFASVSSDDVGVLDQLGSVFMDIARSAGGMPMTYIPRKLAMGYERGKLTVERGEVGLRTALDEVTATDYDRARQISEELRGLAGGGILASTAEVIAQNVAQVREVGAATLIGGGIGTLVGAPGAGAELGYMTGTAITTAKMEAGNLYLDLQEQGVPDDVAVPASLTAGLINGIIEAVGAKIAAAPFKGLVRRVVKERVAEAIAKPTVRAALAQAGKSYVIQVGSEAGEEGLQELTNVITERLSKRASGIVNETTVGEDVDRIIEATIGGAMGSALLGAVGPGANLYVDLRRANRAGKQTEFFDALTKNAAESKTKARDAGAYERYIAAQAAGTQAETVFVDGGTMKGILEQAAITDSQLDAVVPGLAKQVRDAAATGADVTMPTAQYAARLAGTDIGNALLPHMRLSPDAMSATEAQAVMASRQQIVADAEKLLEQRQATDAEFVASAQRVEDRVYEEIMQAGYASKEEARALAQIYQASVVVDAADMGISPEEFDARHQYRHVREGAPMPASAMEQAERIDTDYTAAVERGDMATAQRMVDEAAKASGYNSPRLYKAMPSVDLEGKPITTIQRQSEFPAFNRGEAGVRIAGFFAEDRNVAERFTAITKPAAPIYETYLREDNPYVIDATGRMAGDVQFGPSGLQFRDAIRSGKYDSIIIRNTIDEGTIHVALDPSKIKSADAVTRDEAGNVVPLSRRFDITSPKLFEQAAKAKPGPNAPGIGVSPENKLGFWPALRVISTKKQVLPDKPLILTGTTNKNAAKQLASIDDILGRFETAGDDVATWVNMLAYAFGTNDVPVPPYAFIRDINGNGSFERLSTLTAGQIADASHGFENARAFRQAYISGTLDVTTTGKLFLWSFLSRGVSPYTQESLFIDAFKGADKWIKKASEGKFTERDFAAYEKWAKSVAPQGSGQPGAGATHNLNAFGKNFLVKMGALGPDGKSNLQRLHEMMSDPSQTGKMIRREFATFGEGVGIDNKVVSFTLLVAGFDDVMVLDRVQVRQLWDDGRFSNLNLYDGVMNDDGKKLAGSSLNAITEGVRGILIYEAIERQLAKRITDLYARLGRLEDASIGRYHWETWVAYSQQEAAHATLDAILLDAKGDDQAISKVFGKQGEYGAYEYGAQYNRDSSGNPWFRYVTPLGGTYDFSVPAFRNFLTEIKKAGNKVVPSNFKVSESGNAPWYTRSEVNQQRLEEQAEKWSDRGGGTGEGKRIIRKAAKAADAIRARSRATGQPIGRPGILEQAAAGPARGGFDPFRLTTLISKRTDVSTLFHELIHYKVAIYMDIAGRTDAPARVISDLDELLRFMGVEGDTPEARRANYAAKTIEERKPLEEKVTYNFEIYMSEGRAPSIELEGVFDRMIRWMRRVYKSIRDDLNEIYKREFGTDLPMLTPEVRGVFDRMLADEAQIKRAEAVREMRPMFQTLEEARAAGVTITDEEWAAYQAMAQEATNKAISELTTASIKSMEWLSNARSKFLKEMQAKHDKQRKEVRDQVTAEVRREPLYRAMEYLKRGTLVAEDGTETTVEGVHKINAALAREFVPDLDMAKMGRGKYGYLAEDGLHPDVVAEMFGYPAGSALLKALAEARPMREVVDERTDAVMERDYSDMADPTLREAAVNKAIHNEARARFAAMEARLVSRATQPVRLILEAARQAARDTIGNTVIRNLRPSEFAAAEARAAREAADVVRGSEAALKRAQARYGADATREQVMVRAKQQQVYQNQAATEAQAARDEIDKALKDFRKFFKSDEKIAKTRDMNIVSAARAILASIGLGQSDKTPAQYMAQIAQYNTAVHAELEQIINSAGPAMADYRMLTVEQFRGIRDLVNGLWAQARRDMQLEIEGERVALAEAVGELTARIDAIGVPKVQPGQKMAPGIREKFLRTLFSGRAAGRRVEHWADAMDGKDPARPFTKYLFRRIKGATNNYRVDRNVYVKKYVDLLTALENANLLPSGLIASPELNYTFGNENGGIGIAEVLGGILHMGNESNYRKFILGGRGENFAWGSEREDGTLDDSRWQAFLNRMIAEGKLQKAHFDFIQAVWDLNEELKPIAQKAHFDLYGYYFKEVEAKPLVTPFGTYRGGYVPAKADPFLSVDAQRLMKLDELAEDHRRAMPATAKGFTKARTQITRPLAMDVRMIARHIDEVLRFAHIQPAVADALRILNNREFKAKMNALDPTAIDELLMPWLQRSARQITSEPGKWKGFDAFWRSVRARTGSSIMFANIRNALQQPTGLFPSALKVERRYLQAALARYIASPMKTSNDIAEMSPFMDSTMRNQMYELQETMNDLTLNPSKFKKIQDWSNKHGYFMQTAMQNPVNIVTWLGAYDKSIAESGLTTTDAKAHKNAVADADAAVRLTQGSRDPEDISAFEVGTPFYKTFMQFSGYFNMMANLNVTEYVKAIREGGFRGNKGQLVYIYLLGMALPAIVSDAIVRTFGDGWDDDDEDGYIDTFMDWIFGSQARFVTGMIPFGSTAYTALTTAFNNKPYDDRITSSPSIAALESATIGVGKTIINVADPDKDVTGKNVRDVLTLISLSTGIPVTALGRPIGYLVDVAGERVEAKTPMQVIKGLTTGAGTKVK